MFFFSNDGVHGLEPWTSGDGAFSATVADGLTTHLIVDVTGYFE